MIDAKSLPPVPRAARMKGSYAQARQGWAVAAVVIGIVLLTWLLLENARWQRLAQHGVLVKARVTNRRETTGKGAANFLTLSWSAAGATREEEYTVSSATYQGHDVGATIPLVVDPDDATNSHLLHFEPEDANALLFLWGSGWLVGGVLVLFAFWGDANTVEGQRRMLTAWPLGELTVDRVLPAEAKQTGLFLAGHLTDARGERREVPRLHLPTGFQVRESVPVLYDELSEKVVALASLDKVELA